MEGMWQMTRGGPGAPPFDSGGARGGGAPQGPPPGAGLGNNLVACKPFTPFDMLGAGHPLKFFYTRGEILIMTDGDNLGVRRIFMDGDPHESFDANYSGRAFGRWDGKTLVIETGDFDADANGGEPTATTQLSERFRLVDRNTLELTASTTDPGAQRPPKVQKYAYRRRSDWELQISTCIGTNREEPTPSGTLNLTPPK
jgi:hypothetical protein